MLAPSTEQWILLALLKFYPVQDPVKKLVPIKNLLSLLRNCGSSKNLAQLTDALCSVQTSLMPKEVLEDIDRCLAWSTQAGCSLISLVDSNYPALLQEIADPPPVLFVRGSSAVLDLPQLAIVGSRKPSSGGCKIAKRFAQELAESGFVITSGLALGIDAASHQGTLEVEKPTVAVLGSGLEHIYPARHKNLAAAIIEKGALVSEYPPQCGPRAMHFPQRNRIISGMSYGVLVVEAALNSGSLITARMATAQGREVFAVPGSIQSTLSKGCHLLLKQGAVLVENTDDVLQELQALFQWQQEQLTTMQAGSTCQKPNPQPSYKETDASLLAQIAYNPLNIDELSEALNQSVAELYPKLMQLELAGLIECKAGAYMRTS